MPTKLSSTQIYRRLGGARPTGKSFCVVRVRVPACARVRAPVRACARACVRARVRLRGLYT